MNSKISLPKQWTTAQVRVNPQGKVQVKIAKNKVTTNPSRRKTKKQFSKDWDAGEYHGGTPQGKSISRRRRKQKKVIARPWR